MSKEFLEKLLSAKNSVDSKSNCIICLEKCGTFSENATKEWEVRLPCGHSVGSKCIVTWLTDNNTCPLCRQEFFPCQPRPYMEHELMDGSSESHDNPLILGVAYTRSLRLDNHVARFVWDIIHSAGYLPGTDGRSAECIAAACVYIASHILLSPRSLAAVARHTHVRERWIHDTYQAIFSDRFGLIDEAWRSSVGGETLGQAAEILEHLSWPPFEPDFTQREDPNNDPVELGYDNVPSVSDNIQLVKRLCVKFQRESPRRSISICVLAQKIARQMASMAVDWHSINPWTIAAACTYMAASLLFRARTLEEVGAMSGIPLVLIRRVYRVMYRVRTELTQEEWFAEVPHTKSDALFCLPEPPNSIDCGSFPAAIIAARRDRTV